MASAEWSVFSGLVRCCRRYVEFGSGASTVLAADLASDWVVSFDSSRQWLDRVADACRKRNTRLTPVLSLLDIGDTEAWGFPKGEATRERWPAYHSSMWDDPQLAQADLYLVDGRFRVACFSQVLLHADRQAFIVFHDYASRPYYHCAADFAREVIRVDDLSVFVRRDDIDHRALEQLLKNHAYDPR